MRGAVASMKDIDQFRWLRQRLPDQNYFWFNANEVPIPGISLRKPRLRRNSIRRSVLKRSRASAAGYLHRRKKKYFYECRRRSFACHISKLKWVIYISNGLPPACRAKQCHCFSRLSKAPSRYSIAESPMPHAVLGSDAHAISLNRF